MILSSSSPSAPTFWARIGTISFKWKNRSLLQCFARKVSRLNVWIMRLGLGRACCKTRGERRRMGVFLQEVVAPRIWNGGRSEQHCLDVFELKAWACFVAVWYGMAELTGDRKFYRAAEAVLAVMMVITLHVQRWAPRRWHVVLKDSKTAGLTSRTRCLQGRNGWCEVYMRGSSSRIYRVGDLTTCICVIAVYKSSHWVVGESASCRVSCWVSCLASCWVYASPPWSE
jgi:hypothetical protein